MNKNILVISTSIRKNSNSELLGEEFAKGATNAGGNVEVISLKDKQIAFCKGCLACIDAKKCVIADDAVEIAQKMEKADVIAFATPIYYYEMSGQMKTLLDRCNSLFTMDYAFRDIYMLSTATEDERDTPTGAKNGLQGWISCYPKAKYAGGVFVGGVNDGGAIKGHKGLKEAYELGAKA